MQACRDIQSVNLEALENQIINPVTMTHPWGYPNEELVKILARKRKASSQSSTPRTSTAPYNPFMRGPVIKTPHGKETEPSDPKWSNGSASSSDSKFEIFTTTYGYTFLNIAWLVLKDVAPQVPWLHHDWGTFVVS